MIPVHGIKICGLTRASDAMLATQSGATHTGVILAGGPRNLTLDQARIVLNASGAQRVAVFGSQTVDEIVETVGMLSLDVVQLHGDPTPAFVEDLRARVTCAVWPVVRVDGVHLPPVAHDLARSTYWLVLDARVPGALGGTGKRLDWTGLSEELRILRRGAKELRVVLAGGLQPSNVKEAIDSLFPDIVDVSSGVERSPGVKDPGAMRAFVQAARDAWRGRGDGDEQ